MPKRVTIKFTDLNELMDYSCNFTGSSKTFDCELTLTEEEKEYNAYNVTVCHRDLLFWCDEGVLNYVVDTYGFNHTMSLISIDDAF